MNIEEHKCPNCGRVLNEEDGMYYDVHASANTMGCWYDLWCPDCGATARYHAFAMGTSSWPKPSQWRIPTKTNKDNPQKVPIILAALREKTICLEQAIAANAMLFDNPQGTLSGRVSLARSIVGSKEELDHVKDKIDAIETALAQAKNGIVEEAP